MKIIAPHYFKVRETPILKLPNCTFQEPFKNFKFLYHKVNISS